MLINYKFVNFGSQAGDNIPDNEYWLDVGGQLTTQVFDHHFSDSPFKSTAEIVMHSLERIARLEHREITLTLHQTPDLDGIFASWLFTLATTDLIKAQSQACAELSALVTLHDQGFEDCYAVENSWPITFYTELNARLKSKQDQERIEIGHAIIEETLKQLDKGIPIDLAANNILSAQNKQRLSRSKIIYESDRNKAALFQINLPTINNPEILELVDGIALSNPKTGGLLKHFARRDKSHSKSKQGFTLLIVSTSVNINKDKLPRWRHIISVNPKSGVNLIGMGKALELAEQNKENSLELVLAEGRERIPEGTGRFGWNVPSPWYDGRGHQFTIIDSPAISENKQTWVASVLNPEEVFTIVTTKSGK